MTKFNQTANDAQLKARRTNLEKKTNDELISIILRKDSTERKNNAKIQGLTTLLKEADSLNEEKATRILGFEKDMAGMEDIVKVKQEQIDKLLSDTHNLEETVNKLNKTIVRKDYLVKLKNKVIYSCFSVIAILIILILCIVNS